MNRITLAFALAVTMIAGEASAASGYCSGVFIRRSCKMGASQGICSYPKARGLREDFEGWEIEDGVLGYAVYRLGAYPAKDIRLDPGCKLKKYS